MATAISTTPAMSLPEQIRRMDGERLRAYADNLAFCNGDQWPAGMARSPNRRLVFNYARTPARTPASRTTPARSRSIRPVSAR